MASTLKNEVLAWTRSLPLTRDFAVVTQNDVAMFALGEARFGLARGVNRAMYVTLGTGAGSSFTVNTIHSALYSLAFLALIMPHYDSNTPLFTLTPHLAILAPRLCTGCLPGFAGSGVAPDYTACTELAH